MIDGRDLTCVATLEPRYSQSAFYRPIPHCSPIGPGLGAVAPPPPSHVTLSALINVDRWRPFRQYANERPN